MPIRVAGVPPWLVVSHAQGSVFSHECMHAQFNAYYMPCSFMDCILRYKKNANGKLIKCELKAGDGAGKMAQQVKHLSCQPVDLSLIPGRFMVERES